MSNVAIAAAVLGMVVLAWVFWNTNRGAAESLVTFLNQARYIIGGVWLIIIGYHLLQSGNAVLITLALAGTFALALWAIIERPWAETI